MTEYSYNDLKQMQEQAIRRVREMQERARMTVRENPIPELDGPKPEEKPPEKPKPERTSQKREEKPEPPEKPRPKKQDKVLPHDSDKAILLPLILLLSEENADKMLIFALLYILA